MTRALFSQSLHIAALSTSNRGLTFTKTRKKGEKNALPPLPISAQDPAISINRALARISDSVIPHMHAFTCRCRHLCLSASP